MGNPGNVSAGGGFNYEALLKGLESDDRSQVDAALSRLSPEVLEQLDQLENKDEVARKLLGTLENLKYRRIEVPGGAKGKVKEMVESLKETLGYADVSLKKREVEVLSAGKEIGMARSQQKPTDTQGARKVREFMPPAKIEVPKENKRNFSVEDLKELLEPYAKATRGVELDLSYIFLDREHFEVLQAYEGNIKGLNLRGALETDDSRAACMDFLRSDAVKNLTVLNVGYNRIGDAGAQAIAESPNLQKLNVLYVYGNRMGAAGAQAIAESQNLRKLTTLYIGFNQIGAAGAEAIAQSPNLTNLTTLNVGGNGIGPPGAQAIAQSPNLQNLTKLDVGGNGIGDAGVEAIAQSKNLQNLTVLNVGYNQIGHPGARAIGQSQNLRKLTTLYIGFNRIGDAGAEAIAQSKNLQNLTTLNVSNNQIGPVGAQALRDAFPGCKILF